jgi:hypothetical protein
MMSGLMGIKMMIDTAMIDKYTHTISAYNVLRIDDFGFLVAI